MYGYSKLPLIPGLVVYDNIREKYPLPHNWQYKNGLLMLAEEKTPKTKAVYPPLRTPNLPDWLNFDRQVLCFNAYFKEDLQEIFKAPYQIRQVKILYYLEDGTIQINEERVENSGISQGCIVHRQKIPSSSHQKNETISMFDLNIRKTIKIFDRAYHITNCDEFTRKFLKRSGISVPEPEDMPKDPGQAMREQAAESIQMKQPKTSVETLESKLERFLTLDKQALRFEAYWDDRDSLNGDLWNLIVTYFLIDDTIQINNLNDYGPKMFLQRQRLPKTYNGMPTIGAITNFTVLNVLGGGFLKGRYIPDHLGVGDPKIEYYNAKDLMTGSEINVFGRKVVLCDCDKFTKDYYRKKFGIEEFPTIAKPITTRHYWKDERILPPYNGWGTHEDSEGNCKSIEPKAPHRDFRKFLQLDGFMLRFGAKMQSNIAENHDRTFIVTYYLCDDTISVYEIAEENSGFFNKEFYKRAKYYLPNQEWYTSGRPIQYTAPDLYIGARIILKDFEFLLTAADEFTLSYMENHPFEFPKANIESIAKKIQSAIEPVYKDFVAKYIRNVTTVESKGQTRTFICYDTIRQALTELLGGEIVEHEIVTFIRYFSVDKTKPNQKICNREVIRSVVQFELYRAIWDDVQRVKEYIYHLDPSIVNGYVSEKRLETIIGACKLPIKKVLMENMFTVLNKNENGEIEIGDFLRFIDRREYRGAFLQPMNIYSDVCPKQRFDERIRLVDWDAFIDKLGLEVNITKDTA